MPYTLIKAPTIVNREGMLQTIKICCLDRYRFTRSLCGDVKGHDREFSVNFWLSIPWITDHVVMADFLAVVPKAPQKELQPHGVLDDDDARPRSFIVNVPSAGFFRLE